MSFEGDSELLLDGGIHNRTPGDEQNTQFTDFEYCPRLFACGLCQMSFDHKDRLLQHLTNDHWEPRDNAENRYQVKTRVIGYTAAGRKAKYEPEDIGSRKTALPSKRSSKKTSPASDKDEKTQRQLDVLLGKRKQEYEALEERLKHEPFYDDNSVLLFRFNEQKAGYGGFGGALSTVGGKYMLRKSSTNSRPIQIPKKKTPGKSSASAKQKASSQNAGRRGRPKKRNKEEVTEAEPANWKWRSNVCLPLTDLENVRCGYRGCQKFVNSVISINKAKRMVTSYDEASLYRV
jgi:hypothetical protein